MFFFCSIGFNSVYHLTDLPSFVSGRYVVYFDPHTSYLPNASSVNPGKRIDFVTTGALSAAPDQFSPFIAFGCNMSDEYRGTLFRFPLRTPEQAGLSRLSHQSFSCEDMSQLFRDFEACFCSFWPVISLSASQNKPSLATAGRGRVLNPVSQKRGVG